VQMAVHLPEFALVDLCEQQMLPPIGAVIE
jgi:hypothetical protein